MKNELNRNNSKKLIIGISILFCAVILIIGVTTAFFTQSGVGDTGNIVAVNVEGTILFEDNNDYMFGNFIPVNESDVIKFASKDTDVCNYQDDMYACNLYEFTITNDSNVTQELKITLNPTENGFGNLYYILLEENKDDITLSSKLVSKNQIVKTNSIEMENDLVLNPGSTKTYTIVYYVKNFTDKDQTSEDAGKKFSARVRVDSITTGTYAQTLLDSHCYDYELINDETSEFNGTYKLTAFKGIDNTGIIDTTCGITEENGLYSVTVPSKIKDIETNKEIELSILGDALFIGLNYDTESLTNYSKIVNVEIEEGVKEIGMGTFVGIGLKSIDDSTYYDGVSVSIPSSLKTIGMSAFSYSGLSNIIFNKDNEGNSGLVNIHAFGLAGTQLSSISIPSSVETIGESGIGENINLTKVSFELDKNGNSNLKTIGAYAFANCNIIADKNNPLIIPASVTDIGDSAFAGRNENLSRIVFQDTEEHLSQLETIGEEAFYYLPLMYETDGDPLIIPPSVKTIGASAFSWGSGYKGNLVFIQYLGDSVEILNNNASSNNHWYMSECDGTDCIKTTLLTK